MFYYIIIKIMRLPVVIKFMLNIIFYVIYVLIFSIIISLILPLLFNVIIENGSNIANYIQGIIAFIILFITIIFRKYFYMSFDVIDENKEVLKTKQEKIILSQDGDLEISIGKRK